jgi:hypothetical protein
MGGAVPTFPYGFILCTETNSLSHHFLIYAWGWGRDGDSLLSIHHDILFIFNLHDEFYVGLQSHVSYIKYRIFFQVEDIQHFFLERAIYFVRDKLIGTVHELSHRLWKITVLFIGLALSSFRSATSVSLLKWRLFILHLGTEKERCHEVLLLLSWI